MFLQKQANYFQEKLAEVYSKLENAKQENEQAKQAVRQVTY